jgi:Tfp pilus assembly protein PilF
MKRLVLVAAAVLAAGCITQQRIERAHAKADLGVAYLQERNPEGAVTELRDAVRLDPRNWHAHNALAMAYATKGDAALAESEFKAALRVNPTGGEVLLNYGAFLVTMGRPKEAVPVLERALLDLEYRNPALVLSNLSRAYLEAGNAEEALKRADEAIRRAPKLCPAHYHRGLAHEALGKTDAALRDYAELAEECPDEALGGWLRTGCILAALGDREGAEAAVKHVTDAASDSPMAEQARECLAGKGAGHG